MRGGRAVLGLCCIATSAAFVWPALPAYGAPTLPSRAEQCVARPDAIVADLGLHVVNAGYQRTTGCHLVLQASAGLYVPWMVNLNVLGLGGGDRPPASALKVSGFVVRVRSFVFPLGTAPTGFWVSPFIQAGFVRSGGFTPNVDGFAAAEGLSVGGTFRLGSRVLVALGLGAQFHAAYFHWRSDNPGFALPGPTVDINLGYAL